MCFILDTHTHTGDGSLCWCFPLLVESGHNWLHALTAVI